MADTGRPNSSPRNPNRWQEDQWVFRREYATDAGRFQRTPVFFRWWTRKTILWGGAGVFALVWSVQWIVQLLRGRTPGRLVAVYRRDALPGTPPFLCFEVFEDAFGQAAAGQGEGILVGEPVPNGTLILEADGQVILPLWNPNTETRDAPAW
jgi:hypothetical protein